MQCFQASVSLWSNPWHTVFGNCNVRFNFQCLLKFLFLYVSTADAWALRSLLSNLPTVCFPNGMIKFIYIRVVFVDGVWAVVHYCADYLWVIFITPRIVPHPLARTSILAWELQHCTAYALRMLIRRLFTNEGTAYIVVTEQSSPSKCTSVESVLWRIPFWDFNSLFQKRFYWAQEMSWTWLASN